MTSKFYLNCSLFFITLALVACGGGGDNTQEPVSLTAPDEAMNSFCLNHPDSTSCQKLSQEGLNLGLEQYFSSNDSGENQSSEFTSSPGFCGCKSGFTAVVYKGYRFCENSAKTTKPVKDQSLKVIFSQEIIEGQTWAYYKLAEENLRQSSADVCQHKAELRCTTNDDCKLKHVDGQPKPGTCSRLAGTKYGFCKK